MHTNCFILTVVLGIEGLLSQMDTQLQGQPLTTNVIMNLASLLNLNNAPKVVSTGNNLTSTTAAHMSYIWLYRQNKFGHSNCKTNIHDLKGRYRSVINL